VLAEADTAPVTRKAIAQRFWRTRCQGGRSVA
jgi:hypothetical protein